AAGWSGPGSAITPTFTCRGSSGGAVGWPETIASSRVLQSRGVRAIGPTWSRVHDRGIVPTVGTRSLVGFRPTVPHSPDGIRIDPPVSVPKAAGASPAARAAADPPDEPPGVRSSDHGFFVGGVADP